jgi:hypothetical protein
MASKVAPKISAPGSAKMPTGGAHNPSIGTHGGGGKLANVKSAPVLAKGGFMPLKTNAMANLTGQKIGQKVPDTAATATKKPNRKGGAAFYGET